MITLVLEIIAITLVIRLLDRQSAKQRRQKRHKKLVWFFLKQKLRRLQKEGKLDSKINLNAVKDYEITWE